jgi:hypothetical protein
MAICGGSWSPKTDGGCVDGVEERLDPEGVLDVGEVDDIGDKGL